jgi:asparagine synthetase A
MTKPSDLGFSQESTVEFISLMYKGGFNAALEGINSSSEFHKHSLNGAKEAWYSACSSNRFSAATRTLYELYMTKTAQNTEFQKKLNQDRLNLDSTFRAYLDNWDLPSVLTLTVEEYEKRTNIYYSVPTFSELVLQNECLNVLAKYRGKSFTPEQITFEEAQQLRSQHFNSDYKPKCNLVAFSVCYPSFDEGHNFSN